MRAVWAYMYFFSFSSGKIPVEAFPPESEADPELCVPPPQTSDQSPCETSQDTTQEEIEIIDAGKLSSIWHEKGMFSLSKFKALLQQLQF